nr:condensation domain-containing protein [Kibdelosporangium sp. MJ126-NF4]CEL23083.1 Non-ribosomal peptide synthetase [Kibdelosporangium sp. MJ126-NF4]CTQ90220.1 Non-ribosomal peptide synthetase [Kibdelosporangium sp. MJ126-NF4]
MTVRPLSPSQRALYLVEQLYPGTSMHHVPVAARFDGPLDVPRLEAAIGRIVTRHEALRTTFPAAAQRISPPAVDLPVIEADESSALDLVRQWVAEPFDLEHGPLIRTRLIQLAPQRHILVVVMHQLVTDGPSIHLFFNELADLYDGRDDLPPLPVQPADHAAWQLGHPPSPEDLTWWREQLDGVPTVLRLPTDRPRPRVASMRGANHFHTLPAAVMTPALALARSLRVTLFVLALTAYAALLARMSGQPQVLVGVPVSSRDRAELESVIGFFVNTLPVMVDTTGDPGFGELAKRTQSELLDILGQQEVPFDRLVAELAPDRDPAHSPLVQAFFSFETTPLADPRLTGTTATAIECQPDDAKVDIDMTIFRATEAGDDFRLMITYRTDLFDENTIRRLADRFERLLATAADPHAPLSANPALADIEPPVEPETPRPVAAPTARAHTGMERDLARIWQDVLGLAEVGVHDNFFDLGGTSQALASVRNRLGELTGTPPPLVALLEFPTVAALAQHLAGSATPERPTQRLVAGRDRLRRRRTTR